MAMSPAGLRPERGLRSSNNLKLHTRPLVREGATHKQVCKCLKINKKGEKLISGPGWVPDDKTDWQTGRRSDITFTLLKRNDYRIIGVLGFSDTDMSSSWLHFEFTLVKSCSGWSTGTVRERRRRGTSAVGSRSQRTGEETAGCEK
jgi:hypothetical protein